MLILPNFFFVPITILIKQMPKQQQQEENNKCDLFKDQFYACFNNNNPYICEEYQKLWIECTLRCEENKKQK